MLAPSPRLFVNGALLLGLAGGCGPSLGDPMSSGSHGSDDGETDPSGATGSLQPDGTVDSGEDSGSSDDSSGETTGECEPASSSIEAPEGPLPTCTPTGRPYLYFTTWADQRVYAYDPEANALAYDSVLDCGRCVGSTGIAASTVDGDGMLWLYYPGDGIYVVDPTEMRCNEIALAQDDGLPWIRSLGFVPSGDGGLVYATAAEDEQSTADHTLTIDPVTLETTRIGSIDEPLSFRALAGDDDSRLWGLLDYFNDSPQAALQGQLLELDPSDGLTLATLFELQPTPGASIPSALAWWEGELFALGLYDGAGGAVLHIDPDTADQTMVFEDIRGAAGNNVISTFTGAGASMCP